MSSKQPFPLLPVAEPDLTELEERYVLEAVRSGWVSSIGAFVDRLESLVAGLAGASHAVAVANGTVALQLALAARGIGPGDEVIVPDLTFAATAAVVRHAGATPVLVDADPTTWCMDPELIEQAITKHTKAIIPVHLFGHPADMGSINEIASRKKLFVLEDAAEAHGAKFAGAPVGAIGHAGCFSFYGNKLVTTGEGGAITTHDSEFAARLRYLKDHAMRPQRRYYHDEAGYNYRITNLQAALGCAQLERFSEIVARKRAILDGYRRLQKRHDITLNPAKSPAEPVCWLVCALLPREGHPPVNEVIERLRRDFAVDTRPFFVPMHMLPPYASARLVKRDKSVAADLATRGICLPSSNKLRDEDILRVWSALDASFG